MTGLFVRSDEAKKKAVNEFNKRKEKDALKKKILEKQKKEENKRKEIIERRRKAMRD